MYPNAPRAAASAACRPGAPTRHPAPPHAGIPIAATAARQPEKSRRERKLPQDCGSRSDFGAS